MTPGEWIETTGQITKKAKQKANGRSITAEQWRGAIGRAISRMGKYAHSHDITASRLLKRSKAINNRNREEAAELLQTAIEESHIAAAYIQAIRIIAEELNETKAAKGDAKE